MLRFGAWIAFVCALAGVCFFAAIPYLYVSGIRHYAEAEPFFSLPVAAQNGAVPIRSDGYGKGHFGASRSNGRIHKGIDITSAVGQPVRAAKSGRVIVVDVDKGYGNWIEVLHPDGLSTRYAHLQRMDVIKGQWVIMNQPIGLSGRTGNAANPHIIPHLHFEIRFKKHVLNPFDGLFAPTLKPRT